MVPVIRAPSLMGNKHGEKLCLSITCATTKGRMKYCDHTEEKGSVNLENTNRGDKALEFLSLG